MAAGAWGGLYLRSQRLAIRPQHLQIGSLTSGGSRTCISTRGGASSRACSNGSRSMGRPLSSVAAIGNTSSTPSDRIVDIGRIENVHFNPWWSLKPRLFKWQQEHGEAFIFGRSDWQYVLNTFCFGYNVGYKFVQTAAGVCNGNFLGIGADDCYTAVVVENCAPFALLISNGEFVSFHGPDPTMVRVEA